MRTGCAIKPDDRLAKLSPEQAAAVQVEAWRLTGLSPGAWKLGASNFASREALDLEECFLGPIPTARVHEGNSLELSAPAAIIEAEIAVRLHLKRWIEATDTTLEDNLISIHPAFELPESRFGTIGAAGTGGLIADFGAAGAAMIGQGASPALLMVGNKRLSCRLFVNGEFIAEGDTGALVTEPLALLEGQRRNFSKYPFLPETAFVLLGAMSAVRHIGPGDRVDCQFDFLEMISIGVQAR